MVGKSLRTVPYPLLGENTLVLSDSMVLAKDENGQLALMFRWATHCDECQCELDQGLIECIAMISYLYVRHMFVYVHMRPLYTS